MQYWLSNRDFKVHILGQLKKKKKPDYSIFVTKAYTLYLQGKETEELSNIKAAMY